jgi:hypothetical protein
VSEIHLDDERLSAVVDGLADPDDAAHAASCPDCQAQLQRWRRALGQLTAHPEPTPDVTRREAAITAALAENNAGIEGARKRRRPGPSSVAALAAAVLVVAGLAFGVSQVGGGSTKGTDASAGRSAATTGAGGSPAIVPAASTPSTTEVQAQASSNAATALENLGSIDTPAGLVATLRRASTGATKSSPPGPPLARTTTCLANPAAEASVPSGAAPAFQAALTYKGQPATVWVYTIKTGHVAVVESDSSCALLAKISYP